MRFVLALFIYMVASPVLAQHVPLLKAVPSTPDIEVSITAATTIDFQGPAVNWISVKNDGPGDVYLDLRAGRDAGANEFPLKLEDGESFSAYITLHTITASAGSGNSASAFITVQAARF